MAKKEGHPLRDIPSDFDPEWYIQAYPDVAQVGMDPAEHFAWIGRRLGRKPNGGVAMHPSNTASQPDHTLGGSSVIGSGVSDSAWNLDENLGCMARDPLRWARFNTRIAQNPACVLAPLFRSFNPDSMNLHWIISGELPLNSRQTRVFALIRHLEALGHKQWVWIQPPCSESDVVAYRSVLAAQKIIGARTIIRFLPEDVLGISGDAVIATDFWSCFPAAAMPLFKARFRLTQLLENDCQTNGSMLALSKHADTLEFREICIGQNIEKTKIGSKFWVRHCGEFTDSLFFHNDDDQGSKKSIDVVNIAIDLGNEKSSHIATKILLDSLVSLKSKKIGFVANFFGETPAEFNPSYPFLLHGSIGPSERGKLFRKCQIGLSLAACMDHSIHVEMLACGLETIGLLHSSPSEPRNGLHLVHPSSVAISDAIHDIVSLEKWNDNNSDRLENCSCESSAKSIGEILIEGLSVENKSVPIEKAMAKVACEHKASVIIPTWNGGDLFKNVLESVVSQSTPWSFDILVVDSGSTDNTLEIVQSYHDRGVRLHCIPNSQFQHGRTRNLAISRTSSEFIAVLTQDATPANPDWLKNLVNCFDGGKKIAGVFGAHCAYPDATPFVSLGIEGHFQHFSRLPHVAQWDCEYGEPISYGSVSWQNWLHYYSDNNSCMRRSVWEKIPYPDIDWGEDQVWAWEIIKQGYEKAYAQDAIVYHSHNLNQKQQAKVSSIEGIFWFQYFNYVFESTPEQVQASTNYLAERNTEFSRTHKIEASIRDEQINLDKESIFSRYTAQVKFLSNLYGSSDMED